MAASRYSYTRVSAVVRPPCIKPFDYKLKPHFEHEFDFITAEPLATVQKVLDGRIVEDDAPMRLIKIEKGTRVQSRWNSVWVQPGNEQYPVHLCGQFGEARLTGLYKYSKKDGLTQLTTLDLPGAGTRGELHDM
jgi:hypothetical protein